MKDEKQKIEQIASGIGEQVVSALNSKFEEIISKLEGFEETLNTTLEAIAERQYTADTQHDLFEEWSWVR